MSKPVVGFRQSDGSLMRCTLEVEEICSFCGARWMALREISTGRPVLLHEGDPCERFRALEVNDYLQEQRKAIQARGKS